MGRPWADQGLMTGSIFPISNMFVFNRFTISRVGQLAFWNFAFDFNSQETQTHAPKNVHWVEGQACADPGARTPISASGNLWNIFYIFSNWYFHFLQRNVHLSCQPEYQNMLSTWHLRFIFSNYSDKCCFSKSIFIKLHSVRLFAANFWNVAFLIELVS